MNSFPDIDMAVKNLVKAANNKFKLSDSYLEDGKKYTALAKEALDASKQTRIEAVRLMGQVEDLKRMQTEEGDYNG